MNSRILLAILFAITQSIMVNSICIAPNIRAKIFDQNNETVIPSTNLEEGTIIIFRCNQNFMTSTCNSNAWVPEIPEGLCQFNQCTFPTSIVTEPTHVFNDEIFSYTCPEGLQQRSRDLVKDENGKIITPVKAMSTCHGENFSLETLCISPQHCVIPIVPNGFWHGRYRFSEGDPIPMLRQKSELNNFDILEVTCGTYEIHSQCVDGVWAQDLSEGCSNMCRVIKFQDLENVSPAEFSMIENGEIATYSCKSTVTNSTIAVNFTCRNQRLYGSYKSICYGGCEIKYDQTKYRLLSNFTGEKIPIGTSLDFECIGKDSQHAKFYCSDRNSYMSRCQKVGLSCFQRGFVFGGEPITTDNLLLGERFYYRCINGMVPISTPTFCVMDIYPQLKPEPKCVIPPNWSEALIE